MCLGIGGDSGRGGWKEDRESCLNCDNRSYSEAAVSLVIIESYDVRMLELEDDILTSVLGTSAFMVFHLAGSFKFLAGNS